MNWQPAPLDLSPWVKGFWQVQAEGGGEAAPAFILPDGCMELVIELGPVSTLFDAGGRAVCRERGVVAGQFDRLITLSAAADYGAFGVRFEPWGAAPLLGLPVSELLNGTVPVRSLFGGAGAALEAAVVEAPGFAQRIELLQRFLRRRVPSRARADWLPWAVQHLQGAGTTVRGLARQMQVSPRQLERRFAAEVGLGPKRYAQWLRLRGAIAQARHRPGLTAAAHQAGYADQAHLSRECRQLTGLTPTALLHRLDPLTAALSTL